MADLTKTDPRIIREVYMANAEFGMTPVLLNPRSMKRAKALADRGLLKDGDVELLPNPGNWRAYLTTPAGIEAYNAALDVRGKS